MLNDSHFELLGITRKSTVAEIKKAYRQQIKKWHPDKFQGEPEKLLKAVEMSKLINRAFQLVKDNLTHETNARSLQKEKFGDSKSTSKRTGGKPVFHSVKVNSPNIWSVGYDDFTQILQVEFYESGVHHYYDVPEIVYNQLRYADSVDDYLKNNITWKYRWVKV